MILLFSLILLLWYLLTNKRRIYSRFKSRFEIIGGKSPFPTTMVYCISMPDRIDYVKKQMEKLETPYKLLHAISPKQLSIIDYLTISPNVHLNPFSRLFKRFTKLPVSLSFFMCYYDAYLNGYDSISIFEDDIMFDVSPGEIKKLTSEFVDSDQEVLFLGYCWHKCKNKTEYKQVSPNLYQTPPRKGILCNHALAMKREFFAKYVNRSPIIFYTRTNDKTLSRYMVRHNTKKAIPIEPVVFQNVPLLGSNNENINSNIRKTTCILR